ncbi:MAG: hypothetical protein GF364_22835 [Candidatus Lokiarchaeota archaeon]|nr:hypothetical protein [Candidatus Lokiarchaeota archaeon]
MDCRTIQNRHNKVVKPLARQNPFPTSTLDDGVNAGGISQSWEPLGFGVGVPFRARFISDGTNSVWFSVAGVSLNTAVKAFVSLAIDTTSEPHNSAPQLRLPTVNFIASGSLSCRPTEGVHFAGPIQKASASGCHVIITNTSEVAAISSAGQIQC